MLAVYNCVLFRGEAFELKWLMPACSWSVMPSTICIVGRELFFFSVFSNILLVLCIVDTCREAVNNMTDHLGLERLKYFTSLCLLSRL